MKGASRVSHAIKAFDALAHRVGLDRLAFRVWRYSPLGLLRLYRHHAFDRRLGVQTRGYGDLRYEPTPEEAFEKVMKLLPEELSEFVFVDYGSGKGKVLLLATRYPFRQVVGVELWEDLHAVAVQNLERFRAHPSRKAPVVSVLADAAGFELPAEPLVLYFFNPFPEAVLERVLERLESSLRESPRAAYVVFYAPVRRGTPWDRRRVFDSSGFLEVLREDGGITVYVPKKAVGNGT